MRKPYIENKYNIKPKDIERATVLKPDRLKEEPFWWNSALEAYCLTDNTAKSNNQYIYGLYNEYWIGFYDTKIELKCSAYGGYCNYNFEEFFNPEYMEDEIDLEIQEKLLERINWLIDEGIIEIKERI